MRIYLRRAVLAVCLLLPFSLTAMPMLDIDTNGEILGAKNLEVNGATYDVRFGGGTCIGLFDGCDDISDFTFQSESAALAASQALADVFAASLPLGPMAVIESCLSAIDCVIATPHTLVSAPGDPEQVVSALLEGGFMINSGIPNQLFLSTERDTSTISFITYARWMEGAATVVAAPPVILLLASSLFVLLARARRESSRSATIWSA